MEELNPLIDRRSEQTNSWLYFGLVVLVTICGLLIVLSVFVVSIYVRQEPPARKTITVFYSAYGAEEEAVRAALDEYLPNQYAIIRDDTDFQVNSLESAERAFAVWYVVTGISFSYSSVRLTSIVRFLGIHGVHVFLGSCGGLRSSQSVGDVYLVERGYQTDIGLVNITGRQFALPVGDAFDYMPAPPGVTFFDAPLFPGDMLFQRLPYLVRGTTASQNKFVTEVTDLFQHADIVDMETVPWLYLFRLYQTKAAVIRVVSDIVGVPNQFQQITSQIWKNNLTRVASDVFRALRK